MTPAQRFNFSKITRLAVLGIITAAISTTAYAQSTESGTITGVHLPPQSINTKLRKIDTKIASREAKLTGNAEERKAKMASREAALKAKLQAFKNKRKADITQRINTNLNKINQNQTQQMLKNLDNMSKILDKLEAIVNNNTAITSARETIATTSAAVNEQAQKDYTIQVSSESTVKGDAQAKRDQLHKDLQAVRKDVIDAKQSIYKIFRIAKSGATIKEGSNSAANK